MQNDSLAKAIDDVLTDIEPLDAQIRDEEASYLLAWAILTSSRQTLAVGSPLCHVVQAELEALPNE